MASRASGAAGSRRWSTSGESLAQLDELVSHGVHHRSVLLLVHFRNVDNGLRAEGVTESVEGIFQVDFVGGNGCHHLCLGVATEGVGEDVGQDGLTEGRNLLLLACAV